MWIWSMAVALGCTEVELDDVARAAAPAILVLGERHGSRHDLANAADVVRRLADLGPVTVALEAIGPRHQGVLDELTAGRIGVGRVRRDTDWRDTWGHAFGAYRPLLRVRGVRFVAAGPVLGSKPEGVDVPVPDAYDDRYTDMAQAHGMDDVAAFSAAMAYRDRRIAELAVQGWDQQGILVIVTGRGHVAGGLGVQWQLPQGLSDATTTTALLAPPDPLGPCGPDDRYLP